MDIHLPINNTINTCELKRHHILKNVNILQRHGEMNVLRLFDLRKQGNIICKQICGIDPRALSLCTRTLEMFVLGLQKGPSDKKSLYMSMFVS